MAKISLKGTKICKGCPPKEIKTLTFPKFVMAMPNKATDTKVDTLKGEGENNTPKRRLRRNENPTLF